MIAQTFEWTFFGRENLSNRYTYILTESGKPTCPFWYLQTPNTRFRIISIHKSAVTGDEETASLREESEDEAFCESRNFRWGMVDLVMSDVMSVVCLARLSWFMVVLCVVFTSWFVCVCVLLGYAGINIKISVKKSAHRLFLFSSTSRPSSIWLCLVGKTSQFWLVFAAKLTINWRRISSLFRHTHLFSSSFLHQVSWSQGTNRSTGRRKLCNSQGFRVLTMHGYRSGANKWYIVPFLSSIFFWSLWHKIHADKDLLYLLNMIDLFELLFKDPAFWAEHPQHDLSPRNLITPHMTHRGFISPTSSIDCEASKVNKTAF